VALPVPGGRRHRPVPGFNPGIAFLLGAKRDKRAARRFFRRALGRDNTRHRRGRWLNNRVERDHRRVKRRTGSILGFQSFRTARWTLAGVEAMAMLAKGQGRGMTKPVFATFPAADPRRPAAAARPDQLGTRTLCSV
jgi:transposase-like protein